MSHMITWPDLYQPNKTFIPFNWDFNSFETTITEAINSGKWMEISNEAQCFFKNYISDNNNGHKFLNYFIKILNI